PSCAAAQVSCCFISMESIGKYCAASVSFVVSCGLQRASMKAAAARGSNGNSRTMKRTLPLSTYFALIASKVLLWKAAQCGQVVDMYSTMVTGAFASPSAMSGSAPGLSTSAMSTSPSAAGTSAAADGVAAVVSLEVAVPEEVAGVELALSPVVVWLVSGALAVSFFSSLHAASVTASAATATPE